jgi:mannose-6-phosphate isomerase-like protein (cupin superfamily)
MAIRLRRFSGRSLGFFALVVFFACAPARRISLQYGTEFKQAEIEKMLAENPVGASENIKITTLGQGQGVSHHLVQVRDREKPHIHKLHDGTVVMVKGRGYLMMENRRIDLSAGDIVYIPRGAVHYFVNTASEPTVAFVVFSPPFDGKDTVPVGQALRCY